MMSKSHLNDEQLWAASYGEQIGHNPHLERCPDCQARLQSVAELFDLLRDHPVPERTLSYGADVWARLQPQLRQVNQHRRWRQIWLTAPAAALLLAVVFVAGMLTEHRRADRNPVVVDRVLLTAVSDHLDRAQILLTDLVHAIPSPSAIAQQQQEARDLLNENRILRLSTARHNRPAQAALLGELERTLLDVANSPRTTDSHYMTAVREQIEANSLLFKVRVVTQNIKLKGPTL